MRPDEARDTAALARLALRATTSQIHEVHRGISGRTFRAIGPVGAPVRVLHDAIAGLSYGTVRVALGAGARLAGAVAAGRGNGEGVADAPRGRSVLPFLNGVIGDLVEREGPALALGMTVRAAGRDVPLDPDAVAAAFPGANGRLVVFLHGLVESERSWERRGERHSGPPGHTYGTRLREELGVTPVYLRYNSGLHISSNGRALDELVAQLIAAWPVAVQDVVLVGHSMGGLVARSALHQAAGGTADARPWTALVRDTITLGAPQLGAPLERGVHRLVPVLGRLPETRPLARLLALPSVGIKDLRRGTLVEQDWTARDLDALGPASHTHVPLSDGARHFVVLATIAPRPEGRLADLLGDLMVSPRSAAGDTGDDDRLAYPPDRVVGIGGLHHLDLLNHPRVYDRIRQWLEQRPDAPRAAAAES